MRFLPLLAVLLPVFFTAPVFAGTLFPPENIGANPAVPCPNGTVLSWSGNSVVCQNPSPGVNVTSCPAGQVMTGITNGTPVCAPPATSTLTVSCPTGQVLTGINSGSPVCATAATSTTPLTVSCPSGQVLTGITNGSPVCVATSSITYAFGGMYGTMPFSGSYNNPYTGGLSCPAGYTAHQVFNGSNSCPASVCKLYICYK